VIGTNSPYGQRQLGIVAAHELPANLFGSDRARELAALDRQHYHCALIVADVSNDATYGETLVQTFGRRVVGVHIARSGDGLGCEQRHTQYGPLMVYTVGRTFLLELLHREFQSDLIRLADTPQMRKAYEQLAHLEVEYRDTGTIYQCVAGQHDDLGISFAMLAWTAQHPHLHMWMRDIEASRRPRPRAPRYSWQAWT